MKRLLVVLLALGAFACRTPAATSEHAAAPAPAPAPAPAQPIRITLVGTNDTHGWLEPRVTTLPSGATFEGGGSAVLAGYVKLLREDNPGGVLLLDAGDLFQGTLVANVTEGKAVIDAFDRLEVLEATAEAMIDSRPLGPLVPMSDAVIDELCQAFFK